MSIQSQNYHFGRDWEDRIGKHLREKFGGAYVLSPGSRGPADVINYAPNVILCTQCKASRTKSDATPRAGSREQVKLLELARNLSRSRKKTTVALLALIKGQTVKYLILNKFSPTGDASYCAAKIECSKRKHIDTKNSANSKQKTTHVRKERNPRS